jgi:hypothetical protein
MIPVQLCASGVDYRNVDLSHPKLTPTHITHYTLHITHYGLWIAIIFAINFANLGKGKFAFPLLSQVKNVP